MEGDENKGERRFFRFDGLRTTLNLSINPCTTNVPNQCISNCGERVGIRGFEPFEEEKMRVASINNFRAIESKILGPLKSTVAILIVTRVASMDQRGLRDENETQHDLVRITFNCGSSGSIFKREIVDQVIIKIE